MIGVRQQIGAMRLTDDPLFIAAEPIGDAHIALWIWSTYAPDDEEMALAYNLATLENPVDPSCRFDDPEGDELDD